MSAGFVVVVGLGNPGGQYDGTRHNIGFAVVDALKACSGTANASDIRQQALKYASQALSGSLADGWQHREGCHESNCRVGDWSAQLLKPMTFMNRSGEPLRSYLSFKKIPISQVIVVHDEIDIPFGSVRVKCDGGEGGHNGLRSISDLCGGRNYVRVRVGVGRPAPGSPFLTRPDGVASWVLSRFSSEERGFAEELVAKAADAVVEVAFRGLKAAQNRFHS
jgi:PTH1 family peptidyl-tRNA hydrolase